MVELEAPAMWFPSNCDEKKNMILLRGNIIRAFFDPTAGKSPPKVIDLVKIVPIWGQMSPNGPFGDISPHAE